MFAGVCEKPIIFVSCMKEENTFREKAKDTAEAYVSPRVKAAVVTVAVFF